MTWFKTDDQFGGHPKTVAAGNAAIGLWVRAGTWSARYLTDGFIPASQLVSLGAKPADARALVDCGEAIGKAGLWVPAEGGWQFHDWHEFQPSAEEVRAERAAAAERQRKSRESRKAKRDSERDNDGMSQRDMGVTDA